MWVGEGVWEGGKVKLAPASPEVSISEVSSFRDVQSMDAWHTAYAAGSLGLERGGRRLRCACDTSSTQRGS